MKLPAYYIFTNDELDKIVELKPKTIDELKSADILSSIKIKTHGEAIINEIINMALFILLCIVLKNMCMYDVKK